MARQKEFFNPQLGTTDLYNEIWQEEFVTVKDEHALPVRHHYWQDSTGILWPDFDNPFENSQADFDAYRARRGYTTPLQLRAMRVKAGCSIEEFADMLGLLPEAIAQIENNQRLQVKYHEAAFQQYRELHSLDNYF